MKVCRFVVAVIVGIIVLSNIAYAVDLPEVNPNEHTYLFRTGFLKMLFGETEYFFEFNIFQGKFILHVNLFEGNGFFDVFVVSKDEDNKQEIQHYSKGKIKMENLLFGKEEEGDVKDFTIGGAGKIYSYGPNNHYIDSFASLNNSVIEITDGTHSIIHNNAVSVTSAYHIKADPSKIEENSNEKFYVGQAELVEIGCIKVTTPKRSKFIVNAESTEIMPEQDTKISIAGCEGHNFTFLSMSNYSKITVSEDNKVYAENGTVEIIKNNYRESVQANNSAEITILLEEGIECLYVKPTASYYYSSLDDPRKDFGIHVPMYSDGYKLCLRKKTWQNFRGCSECGVVDFVDNSLFLNGTADYMRYSFKNKRLKHLVLIPVYKGYKNSVSSILLGTSSVFMQRLDTDAFKLSELCSETFPDNYLEIKEQQVGNELHTFARINHSMNHLELNSNLLGNYNEGSVSENTMTYKNSILLPPLHESINGVLE